MANKKSEKSKQGIVRAIEMDSSPQNNISIALTEHQKLLKVGDKVKVTEGAFIYSSEKQFPVGFYDHVYFIIWIKNDCAVLSLEQSYGMGGSMAGAVYIHDLVKVK